MSLNKVIVLACALFLLVGIVSGISTWKAEYTTMDIGVFSFGTGNGNTYAGTGTEGRIYYDDGGAGWCLAYDTAEDTIRAILEWGEYTYFGTDDDGVIYRTNGTSLDVANDTAEAGIYCFEPFGSYLYAGTSTSAKILRTSDGLSWNEVEDLTDDVVYCLENYKGYLYAGVGITPGRLYRSADGTTYTPFYNFTEMYVYDMEIFDGHLYVAVGGGAGDANIYRCDGTSVVLDYTVTDSLNVWCLKEHDGVLYAGTDTGKIYRTYGGGWEVDFETLGSYTYALGSSEYYVYAGIYQPGDIFSLYRNATTEGWGYTYPPHTVKLEIATGFGAPLVGATVTATPVETTMGSWSWLSDIFGISNDVNIAGKTLTGTTDNTGSISFLMVESIQYRVNVTHADIANYSTLIYPQETRYLLFVDDVDWFESGSNINDVVYFNVTTAEVNATAATITIIGNDTASGFTSGTVYLNQTNSTTPGVQDNIDSYAIPAGSNFTHAFTVTNYSGDSYLVQFEGIHSDFGDIARSWGVTFPIEPVNPMGLSDTSLMWISMVIILVTGLIFTATTSWQGPLLTCFMAWILYGIGWMNAYSTYALIALPAATALSVFIVISARRDAK